MLPDIYLYPHFGISGFQGAPTPSTNMGGQQTPSERVQQLMKLLETPSPTPPRKIGPGINILGALGDALQAKAAVMAGGAPPDMGPFQRLKLGRQEQYRAEKEAADRQAMDLRNRIRIGEFDRQEQERIKAEERQRDEVIRQQDIAREDKRFQQTLAQTQQRVDLEARRAKLAESRMDEAKKLREQERLDAEDAKLRLDAGLMARFDMMENQAAGLANSAWSLIERLREEGSPDSRFQADLLEEQRRSLLANVNLSRDKSTDPNVHDFLQSGIAGLADAMGSASESRAAPSGRKGVNITATTVKQVSERNATIRQLTSAIDGLQNLEREMGRRGIQVQGLLLPKIAQDPMLKDVDQKIANIMADIRSEKFGATLPEGELAVAKRFIAEGLELDLTGLMSKLRNLSEIQRTKQTEFRDAWAAVDPEGASRLFQSFEALPSSAAEPPSGVPNGAVFIGTIDGKNAYQTPSGDVWVDE